MCVIKVWRLYGNGNKFLQEDMFHYFHICYTRIYETCVYLVSSACNIVTYMMFALKFLYISIFYKRKMGRKA